MTEARTPAPRWRAWAERALWAGVVAFVLYRFVPDPRLPDLGAAPAVRYAALDGETVGPADVAGQVVVLNVWATWCGPCIVETPGFVDLSREFAGDVQFLGVSVDEDVTDVRRFVARYEVPYPILFGPPVSGTALRAPVLPTTLVIDRRGRVRLRHEGLLLEPVLRSALKALAKEAR